MFQELMREPLHEPSEAEDWILEEVCYQEIWDDLEEEEEDFIDEEPEEEDEIPPGDDGEVSKRPLRRMRKNRRNSCRPPQDDKKRRSRNRPGKSNACMSSTSPRKGKQGYKPHGGEVPGL